MNPVLMSASDVLRVARARGFAVDIHPGPPRMPMLVGGDDSQRSYGLSECLKAFREEIIELLSETTNA